VIRAAVLGSPVSHSLSPLLHRTAYHVLGLDGEYSAIEVLASELATFIENRDQTWTGFSLTMPLKEEILKIADSVDPLALQIQSANTLIRSSSGWQALTTDVSGFQWALNGRQKTLYEKVLIIGAGATARAAAAACDEIGRSIVVVSGNPGREDAMKDAVCKAAVSFIDWNVDLPEVDLLINATPSGVADFFVHQFTSPPRALYFDALYHPWPTKLLAHWKALGGETIDGLDLLVHQGIDQISLMCNIVIDHNYLAPILRAAALKFLEK
jgi:shikimate dehydrogenase